MSEGSLSQVWEMPAIAPMAQNRRRAEQRDELAAFLDAGATNSD
jgi:hypothetical protein